MPSYDDDGLTEDEKTLFSHLINAKTKDERFQLLIRLKNLLSGSQRSKWVFIRANILEHFIKYLHEYSSKDDEDLLIEIFDCLSSLSKTSSNEIVQQIQQFKYLQQTFVLLSTNIDSDRFVQSALRFVRSLTNRFEDILTIDSFDLFRHFLSSSNRTTQILVLEILSSISIDSIRFEDFAERVHQILLVKSNNEHLIGMALKFFASISFENSTISQYLHQMIDRETNETLSDLISSFLIRTSRNELISLNASKYFVHLRKSNLISADHPSLCLYSLTTLIHLAIKSPSMIIDCLNTLIYLLDGNTSLHHPTIYTEQFFNQLLIYICTPNKISDRIVDETIRTKIRAVSMTLMAILASHHVDIQKRISDQEKLIATAIESYRSNDRSLQLASLRLFHGLSRSVDQLHTTFNDTICDILLDALKSSDISLVKTSSCVVSNSVLEFSTCRTKLLTGGILNILLSFLSHNDDELAMNSIWALRNLSYLSTLKIKQDIIQGLTIERFYSLLEQTTDEKFLLCLLSLLFNLLHEKDLSTILPQFNAKKLQIVLQRIFDKDQPEKIRSELRRLIELINASEHSSQRRASNESINSTCRTCLFPDYACDDMDQLDCS